MNEISAHMNVNLVRSSTPFAMWDYSEKEAIYEDLSPHQNLNMLVPHNWTCHPPELYEINFYCLYPSLRYLWYSCLSGCFLCLLMKIHLIFKCSEIKCGCWLSTKLLIVVVFGCIKQSVTFLIINIQS
jgi:hypothetical protein